MASLRLSTVWPETAGGRTGGCRLGHMHLLLAVAAAAILTSAGSAAGPAVRADAPISAVAVAARPATRTAYRAPLSPLRVLTPFTPPLTRYGAGHLGLDLAAATGTQVLAAGDGVVRFAGSVAGRGVVVLGHPDGISTEYEPVTAVVVRGQSMVAGQPIGRVQGRHRSCAPRSCLHWGARRGADYLDPLTLLMPLGVVRLLPWDSWAGTWDS